MQNRENLYNYYQHANFITLMTHALQFVLKIRMWLRIVYSWIPQKLKN